MLEKERERRWQRKYTEKQLKKEELSGRQKEKEIVEEKKTAKKKQRENLCKIH